jgi:Tol biopolymer transport system component
LADGQRVVFVASDDTGRSPVWLAALNGRFQIGRLVPALLQP